MRGQRFGLSFVFVLLWVVGVTFMAWASGALVTVNAPVRVSATVNPTCNIDLDRQMSQSDLQAGMFYVRYNCSKGTRLRWWMDQDGHVESVENRAFPLNFHRDAGMVRQAGYAPAGSYRTLNVQF